MDKFWIHNKRFDLSWILLPPFIVALIVVLFHQRLQAIQSAYPFWVWLFVIVFIDVAHVYASLFRTYVIKSKWQKHKRLFILVPLCCFVLSVGLFQLGSTLFWSVLAYIAVFHFIRQQFGMMRLYGRNEELSRRDRLWDALAIYNATLYPMFYWFTHPDRAFTWFMPDDFVRLSMDGMESIGWWVYVVILLLYVVRCVKKYTLTKVLNFPKYALIGGTYLSWYLGIVQFNTEIAFTLLNVISHGIPYIALVYHMDMEKADYAVFRHKRWSWPVKIGFYLGILLMLAFVEEFLWEGLVWQEYFEASPIILSEFWMVPLLALPQFTHYVLDAFIWKKGY